VEEMRPMSKTGTCASAHPRSLPGFDLCYGSVASCEPARLTEQGSRQPTVQMSDVEDDLRKLQ
ncbi:MAG: hypothetical protein Q9174_004033, partial [Haloplaca sp. 1 TL-2023]